MRLELKQLTEPLLIAPLLAALALGGMLRARADFTATGAAAQIAVSATPNVITLPGEKGGSLLNKSAYRVWVGFTIEKNVTPAVSLDTITRNNQVWMDSGDAIEIPHGIKSLVLQTDGVTSNGNRLPLTVLYLARGD